MELITGNKFKMLADFIIDENTRDIPLPKSDKNVYFIKTDPLYVHAFFERVRTHIDFPYKIITHNADYPVGDDYSWYLDDPFLIKWWGMNAYLEHPKLEPIPIGIANEQWPHGNEGILRKVMSMDIDRKDRIYCNFDVGTSPERKKIVDMLGIYDNIDFETEKLSFEDYLIKLKSYKYTISPEGNGQDCHRIWESLYVGTIPIVKYHPCFRTFKDLPINFIESWDDMQIDPQQNKYEALDFNYYKEKIV